MGRKRIYFGRRLKIAKLGIKLALYMSPTTGMLGVISQVNPCKVSIHQTLRSTFLSWFGVRGSCLRFFPERFEVFLSRVAQSLVPRLPACGYWAEPMPACPSCRLLRNHVCGSVPPCRACPRQGCCNCGSVCCFGSFQAPLGPELEGGTSLFLSDQLISENLNKNQELRVKNQIQVERPRHSPALLFLS